MPITFTDIFPPPYNEYLITYFIPFILLFAIFWGLLSMMKIFSRRINTFLALIFPLVFILGAPETFLWFSSYLISLGSFLAVGAFVVLFVFGAIRWAFHRGWDIYSDTKGVNIKLAKKQDEKLKLIRKLKQSTNQGEQKDLIKRIKEVEDEIQLLEAERMQT